MRELGETVRLDRAIAVFTSRDIASPAKAAADHLAAIRSCGLPAVVQAHVDAWRRKWETAEVRIVGDERAQHALRFATYHLIAAVNPADDRVSIGARGLTGEAYRGHVFWDTEIYMLPFYVFTDPSAARALLMYRYHTLDAARRKAKAHGFEGALYAWESADTGDETTPRSTITSDGRVAIIYTGETEHHISADIAYAVWQYWYVTGDDAFMLAAGAEILVETARFWTSRAAVERDGRAHIRQVIGPDEYHEMVDDNAYTNAMAIFNLECAAHTFEFLERERIADWKELSARLGITEKSPAPGERLQPRWSRASIPQPNSLSSSPAISSSMKSTSSPCEATRCRLTLALDRSARAARKRSSRRMWWRSARSCGINGPPQCTRRTLTTTNPGLHMAVP